MNPESHKILIVDDEEANRYTVSRYLRQAGYEVIEAGNGRTALQLAKTLPSLIVLDVGLPDVSGFDVCEELKTNPVTAGIPIIQTSATFRTMADKSFSLDKGADGYLTSPFESKELLATVKALIRMKKADQTVHALAAEWQTTFDSISSGICLLFQDGTIRRHNRAFAALLGESGADLSSKPLGALLHKASIPDSPLRRIWQTHHRETMEVQIQDRFLNFISDPILSSEGVPEGAVCIMEDITVRKLAEIALQEAKEKLNAHADQLETKVQQRTSELEKRNELLEEFCYSIAHDLRTPLRSISMFSALLRENYGGKFDADGQHYIQRVADASLRLHRLVEDLLTYGLVVNNEIALGPVDLNEQMFSVLKEMHEDIQAKNAIVSVEESLPKVRAHPFLLSQVLTNLISNGLKFAPDDKVAQITIRSEKRPDAILLWIEDNGIGISTDHHQRIFHMFQRLHLAESSFPGTGIGLAIVRRAMERMGGEVGVESEVGKGSRFWLKFQPLM